MKTRVLIVLVSIASISVIASCGSNGASNSDVEATTPTNPAVAETHRALNHYGSFESFSMKTSSEHYQLVSLGNRSVGENKPSSSNNRLEDPLSNLMRGVQ